MFGNKTNVHESGEQKSGWKRGLLPCIVLVALLVSSFGGSFAMYRSTARMEFGTAGVAAYVVRAGADDIQKDLAIDCNGTDNAEAFTFWVKNSNDKTTAEVDIKYDIQVKLTEALPNGVTMKVDGLDGTADADGRTYTFENADWTFEANAAETTQHALQFDADATVVESDLTISSVVITVMTEQIN